MLTFGVMLHITLASCSVGEMFPELDGSSAYVVQLSSAAAAQAVLPTLLAMKSRGHYIRYLGYDVDLDGKLVMAFDIGVHSRRPITAI